MHIPLGFVSFNNPPMVRAEFVYNSAEFPPLNSAELTRSSTEHAQQKPFSAAAASSAVKPTPPDSEKIFLAGSNSTSIGTTNTINGRPTIIFSDAETQSLAANFRYALVGKFSHGSPPYSQLHRLLSNSGIKEAFTSSMLFKHESASEIDLLKPLVKEIDLQINDTTFVQKVEYEQVPPYCSLCKHVGHHELECYTKGSAPKPPPRAKQTKDKTVNDEHATVNDNDENVEPFIVGNDISIVNENAIIETLMEENAIVEALVEENTIVETLVETIVEESVEHTLVENENEKMNDYACEP
ncbi:UNVERIFIED_CONTAM: hypothetical protein Sradi_4093700 [Sesamum radiatum]|uniref:DUF4283 domain-containing protein n=1 Tax=Sesamum radiatum TaxID=300843 RepID=A0AAW2PN23_SESRA